jgi:hypothetical protein
MDSQGNYVVTWASNGQDGSGWGVYARCYNASGVAQGNAFRVSTTTAGDQMYSTVAMDAAGDFVITWSSNGQDGSGWGVYGQRYNATGKAQGGEFQVNTTTAGDQEYSTVAMDGSGNFTITWSSYGQDGGGWGVYGQQYVAGGTPLGIELQINTTTAGDQKFSNVATDSLGHMVVAWSGNGATDSSGIYVQRFNLGSAPEDQPGSDVLSVTGGDEPADLRSAAANLSAAGTAAGPTGSPPVAPSASFAQALAGTGLASLQVGGTRVAASSGVGGVLPSAGALPTIDLPSEAGLARLLSSVLPSAAASPVSAGSFLRSDGTEGQAADDADGIQNEHLLDPLPLAVFSDTDLLPVGATAMTWAAEPQTGAAAWQQSTETYFATEEPGSQATPTTSYAAPAGEVTRHLGLETTVALAVLVGSYPVLLRREWDAERRATNRA